MNHKFSFYGIFIFYALAVLCMVASAPEPEATWACVGSAPSHL
jgi:hypothetical protein